MNVLRRFLLLSRSQWMWMLAGVALGVLVVSANVLLMALSGWFIASMAVAGVSGAAFNFFFPSAAIRFLAISRTVGRYAERLVTHEAAFRTLSSLRVWLFGRLAPLGPAGLERYAAGDVAGRLRVDVDALESLYLRVIAPIVTGVLVLVAGVLFAYCFSPAIAVALAAVLLACLLFVPFLAALLSRIPGRDATRQTALLRSSVAEGVRGVEELILLGAVERQAQRVDDFSAVLVERQEQLGRVQGITQAGIVLFSGGAAALILVVAADLVSSSQLAGPELVMLLLLTTALFEVAGPFSAAFLMYPAARESADRLFSLINSASDRSGTELTQVMPVRFDINARELSAGYLPDKPVLDRVSFSLSHAACGVVVGPSGSGKTLLGQVVQKFRAYDGSLTLGNHELRSLSSEDLPGILAVLPQRPHLFNGSIRENIVMGRESITEHALQLALHDSCLDSWIAALPEGLDTPVGELGSRVSGGEARRIALARALVAETPLLLLDEPTEGLDSMTESELVCRLRNRFAVAGTTVLVISHRPACFSLGNIIVRLSLTKLSR